MKKTNKFILSVATITMLSGVVGPLNITGEASSNISSTSKAKVLEELKADFQDFNIYGPKSNPKGILSNDSYVITSYNTAENILTSKDRKDFLATYKKAKSKGLTTKNNATVNSIQKQYSKIINYVEGAKYTTKYKNLVSKYSNSFKELLTENEYVAVGANDKGNTSKSRGKALKEYTDFKKLVGSTSPKRISSLQKMYQDSTNFSLASHAVNLANSQSMKTSASIKKAEKYVSSAKKYASNVTNSTGKTTINKEVAKTTNKIAAAKKQLSSNTGSTVKPPSNNTGGSTNNNNNNTSSSVSAYEKEVLTLVNKERAKAGLQALKLDTELSKVARIKSKDMQTNGYFDHNSPTYGSPFDMMKKFGISYKSAGENIAYGQTTPSAVVTAWMNSEGHRRNIMSSSFTHIGIGYHSTGHYWTQMFISK